MALCVIPRPFGRTALASTCALGLALAVAGCDDAVSPDAVADTYVLVATGGASFPVAIIDNEYVTVSLLADTFRLRRDRTGSHTRSQRVMEHGPQPIESTHTWTSEFGYVIRSDRFEISYECPAFFPSFTSCVAPPHEIGRWVPGGFVLESLPTGFLYMRSTG
jgi:hypothetical protein